jgi:hypothetical protein
MSQVKKYENIRVFPNSGHQYVDIPLNVLLEGQDSAIIDKLVRGNQSLSWKKWNSYMPWLLYRYENRDGDPFLCLCIETNLGTPHRGVVFGVDGDTHEEPIDEEEIVNPYACYDESQLYDDYKGGILPLKSLPNKDGRTIEIDLSIEWVKRVGNRPVDVDLIVDLGNTRTVALLLECPHPNAPKPPIDRRVQIVRFIPRGTPFTQPNFGEGNNALSDDCAIIDSWMLLHRTQFNQIEPPLSEEKITQASDAEYDAKGNPVGYVYKKYLPHTFVELSPAIIGGGRRSPKSARRIYSALNNLNRGGRFFLGSPKRYVWDRAQQGGDAGGTVWMQVRNDTDADIGQGKYDRLGGLVSYFMDPHGMDWDIEHPEILRFPEQSPTYPRGDALCWFALSILETAYRQINSQAYLDYTNDPSMVSLPRRLRYIKITYPAGWTGEERDEFMRQWQRAVNLFSITRFENLAPIETDFSRGGLRPVISGDCIDEAVCSQLPIIYSDIRTLMNDGEQGLSLYGDGERVTIMNVDIGGGTTDMAIMRYSLAPEHQRGNGASLQTQLLFRDGCAIAGDMLVKRIIETVLIPEWIRSSVGAQLDKNPQAWTRLKGFFKRPSDSQFRSVDTIATVKLARIVRLVFVPLVNQWLSQLVKGAETSDQSWEKLNIGEALEQNLIDNQALKELNEMANKVVGSSVGLEGDVFSAESGTYVQSDRQTIENCVDEVFGSLFDKLALMAGRFDCQLVIVSGKPSELPRIKERFARNFPLLPQRIIHMKNFPAGFWYPFCDPMSGRILDAKTCTVVGAALHQDIINGNLAGLSVKDECSDRAPHQCTWSVIRTSGASDDDAPFILFSPADYPDGDGDEISSMPKTFTVTLPCRIGRDIVQVPGVKPDPVYEIYQDCSHSQPISNLRVEVTLQWFSQKHKGEKLVMTNVKALPGSAVCDPSDVHMRLNTMIEQSHWLDEPTFDLA